MAATRQKNRRGKSTRRSTRGRGGRRKPAAAGRSSSSGSRKRSKGNRRVDPDAREGKGRKRERDPAEFKARNRTILLLLVLAFVNAWIFLWRDEGSLDAFEAKAAVIGGEDRGGYANPIDDACGGDPVDIFFGLDDRIRLESKLNEGRTLRLALLELGVAAEDIDELEAAVRKTVDLGMLTGSGAPVRIAGDREGGLQALEVELAEGHLIQACRSAKGLEVRNIQHPLRVDVAVIALELPRNGDLVEAALDAGQTPALARRIAETLAGEIDFSADVRPGDHIQVLVEKRYLGRNFHRYGKLLAIRYIGNAGRMAFYRYKPVGKDEAFFDHEGRPMRRALLRTPFAWHPFDPESRAALAPAIEFIDGRMGSVYRRATGVPVVALGDGTVRRVGLEGDDGLVVELELDGQDGRRVRYANLLRTIGELQPGDHVEQGRVLALVGQTGKTPVPRLRLELLDKAGERLDPMALGERGEGRATRVGDPVPDEQLDQYREDIMSWRRAMRKAAG